MRSWHRLASLCGASLLLFEVMSASAQEVGFDIQTLIERGLDPAVAAYLGRTPRFTPGVHKVTLRVNGRAAGSVNVRVTEAGELCFEPALLDAAQLMAPPAPSDGSDSDCRRFQVHYPQTEVRLDPQNAIVDLLVPTQALRPTNPGFSLTHYASGGVAGTLNYDLGWAEHRVAGARYDAWTARTELGLNAGDWVLRSNQIFSRLGGMHRAELLDAYAQHTFAEHATVLQLGQIHLTNTVLGGLPVNGAQLFPEQALTRRGAVRRIEGIAHTEASVEVRQGGRLLDTFLVPAGPFSVDLPVWVDANRATQVTIVEADGQRRESRLPSSPVETLDLPAGFTFGLGTLRDYPQAPGLLSAGWSGALGMGLASSVGVLSSASYQSVGFGLGQRPWASAELTSTLRHAHVAQGALMGAQVQVQLSQGLAQNWHSTVGYLRQTSGYREFHDALPGNDRPERRLGERDQLSLTVSWQHAPLGVLSLSHVQTRLSDGKQIGHSSMGWSRRFGQVTVNGTAEWHSAAGQGRGRAVHLEASVPLGGSRRLRASMFGSGEARRGRLSMSERVNEQVAYDLGLEQQSQADVLQSRIGLSLLSRYNQMRIDHADNGGGRRSLSARMHGAAVAHDEGVTLSPYPVQDTFALLKVGALSKIRVNTPSGPVWTDSQGRAVAGRVEPYGKTPVQVQAHSVPRNVELDNAIATVQARRGAVARVAFDVYKRRRLLLQATSNGQPLPVGASVSDDATGFVTLVQNGGLVFLHDFQDGRRLTVESPELGICQLEFQVSEHAPPDLYYETLPASCRSV
ncbi:fimbria/pilus outer membrane usher protein [Pseudomonas sp. NPDC089996]|uniref:fimbria/pilus outer membrane usher protein n=1 Tax=Pseudomonas sp. NPDC089996 TaxID=3364474 RepID=UPI0037F8D899